jgi:hypothetical protein
MSGRIPTLEVNHGNCEEEAGEEGSQEGSQEEEVVDRSAGKLLEQLPSKRTRPSPREPPTDRSPLPARGPKPSSARLACQLRAPLRFLLARLGLHERPARTNYFYARTVTGREFAMPRVEPRADFRTVH